MEDRFAVLGVGTNLTDAARSELEAMGLESAAARRVEGIDAEKVARVARLTLLLTAAVAEDQLPPAWNAGSLEEVRALLADSPF